MKEFFSSCSLKVYRIVISAIIALIFYIRIVVLGNSEAGEIIYRVFDFFMIFIFIYLLSKLIFTKNRYYKHINFFLTPIILYTIISESVYELSDSFYYNMIFQIIIVNFMCFALRWINDTRIKTAKKFEIYFNLIILITISVYVFIILNGIVKESGSFIEGLMTFSMIFVLHILPFIYLCDSFPIRKDEIPLKVTLNEYKPACYALYNDRVVEYDRNMSEENCIFFNKNIEVLWLKKNSVFTKESGKSLSEGTLIKLSHFSKYKYFTFKYNDNFYKIRLKFAKDPNNKLYIEKVEWYRYWFIYYLIVRFAFFCKGKISKPKTIVLNDYLTTIFKENIYYNDSMFESFDKVITEKKDEYQKLLLMDNKYGVGKSSYIRSLMSSRNKKTKVFSYESFKYKDVLSDILISFRNYFRPSNLVLLTLILAVFIGLFESAVSFFGVGIRENIFVSIQENVPALGIIVDTLYGLVDQVLVSLLLEVSTEEALLLGFVAFTLFMYFNLSYLHTYNFGTTKDSKAIIEGISKHLDGNTYIIVEDLDRLFNVEEIYNVLFEISYLYTKNKDGYVGIVSLDLDMVKSKLNCKYRNCMSCNKINQCDFYQLLKRCYVPLNVNFSHVSNDYKQAICDLDTKLDTNLSDGLSSINNIRDIRRQITKNIDNV